MYLLSWILVGLVAGWLGGKILKGDGYGTVMDIAMGIGGAVAGGLLMQSAGLGGRWGAISTTVVAVIGAIFLTLLAGFVNGGGRHANENDAQFNSLFCCPASYDTIASWTGSFQVSALYVWNEPNQSIGAY